MKQTEPPGKRRRGNITVKDGDLELWKRFRKLGLSQGYTARGFLEKVMHDVLGESPQE